MTNSSLKLLQLTDPHLYGDPGRSLRGVPTLPALRETLAAARGDLRDCDAILATGDLVQDDPDGYAHFRAEFGGLGKPVLCIPGNHDDVPAMQAALTGPAFQLGGVRDMGRWRIVLLDSSVPGEVAGHLSAQTLLDLEAALGARTDAHTLIALHHHPVPMGSAWLDGVALRNAGEFFAVVDRHPQVRGIVFGHVHQAFESERRGVRILGTPSTCSQFLPGVAHFAVDEQPPAWRRLTLHPNGSIDTEVTWLDTRKVAGLAAD